MPRRSRVRRSGGNGDVIEEIACVTPDEMLAYVDKLNELDTKDVAPTTQVGEAGTPMRDDEVTNRPAADAMLANAPSSERGYFKVPKIIE